MMKQIQSDGLKSNCIFPLRTDVIPKHIRIDTTTLVHLLLTKKFGKKSDYLFKGNLKRNEDKIWNFFFRTERQCFKKNGYSFHHMIETDGIGCSLVLIRTDMIGRKVRTSKNIGKEKYIDELVKEELEQIKDKTIIAIDPNLGDLIYCVDKDDKSANQFRYTQNQRRKECKIKKYSKIIITTMSINSVQNMDMF